MESNYNWFESYEVVAICFAKVSYYLEIQICFLFGKFFYTKLSKNNIEIALSWHSSITLTKVYWSIAKMIIGWLITWQNIFNRQKESVRSIEIDECFGLRTVSSESQVSWDRENILLWAGQSRAVAGTSSSSLRRGYAGAPLPMKRTTTHYTYCSHTWSHIIRQNLYMHGLFLESSSSQIKNSFWIYNDFLFLFYILYFLFIICFQCELVNIIDIASIIVLWPWILREIVKRMLKRRSGKFSCICEKRVLWLIVFV